MRRYPPVIDAGGFALLEVLVAMTILALVGLMAWRGMDAMIRGSEVIAQRSKVDNQYFGLVRQFDRDCHEILSPKEIDSVPIAYGKNNLWFVRRQQVDGREVVLVVGYVMSDGVLRRVTSPPLRNRSEFSVLWAGIVRDPDLSSSDLIVSSQWSDIHQQLFFLARPDNSNPIDLPRGLTMRWQVNGFSLPIIRSCLLGGSL